MRGSKTIITALLASTVMASAAQAQTADGAGQEAEIDEGNVIVVTATKRDSNIQDVPIAVTALSPVQLEREGIQDIGAIGRLSPSFNLQSSQTESQGTSIRIRGIGTTGNNIGLESAVGVFIDGVYQSRPGIALGELLDIQGIEVLRGPQGTLFGRNTTAGAISISTVKPDLSEAGGFANASYGNFDAINLQAGVNIPVVQDQLALRFSGAHSKRDGFLTSSFEPGVDSNDQDRIILRGQALWEPNVDVSIRLIADYQKTDENCCVAATLTGNPLIETAGFTNFFPAVGIKDSLKDRRFNSQVFENDIEQWGMSGELNWNIGDVTLTYIGSYRYFRGESIQDEFTPALVYSLSGAAVGADPNADPFTDRITTSTHELRLQGEAFDGRLDWLVGAYYADEKIEEQFSLFLGPDYSSVISAANFGDPGALGLISAGGNFLANGGMNPADFTPIDSNGSFATNRFEQKAKSVSIFAHNIIEFTDTLSLTLGARYVDDSKDARYDQLAANNPACLASLALAGALAADAANGTTVVSDAFAPFGAPVQGLLTNAAAVNGGAFVNCNAFAAPALGGVIPGSFLPTEFDRSFSDDELIYTVKASWKPNPDLLFYAGFTHGYKAGGFNLDVGAATLGADPSFASEEVDAYEIGLKSTLANGAVRANLALFYSSMDNFQVLEFTGLGFDVFNVNDVSSKGFEAEVFADFTDSLSGNLAVTYTDAAYGSDCDNGGALTAATLLCSASLTNAPSWVSVAGLTYDGELNEAGWGFLANVSGRFESDRRTSTLPVSAPGVPLPFDIQQQNLKLNARIGVSSPDDRVTIELWGLNLTDKITRGVTFNIPFQGTARGAFIDAPRTYGLTARVKF